LYRINLDGSDLTKVVALNSTANFLRGEVSPVPNSQGLHRITCIDRGPSGSYGVFVVNEDGTDLRPLTLLGSNYDPTRSPDGQRIAYVHYDDGNDYNPETDGLRLLTLGEDEHGGAVVLSDVLLASVSSDSVNFFHFFDLSFSKTADKIYSSVNANWLSDDLWALHLDDEVNPSQWEQLTHNPDIMERWVSGSADDSRIAYEIKGVIYVANSDGSDPVTLPNVIGMKGKNTVTENRWDPCFKR
jgi:hypothetical protein